MNEKVYSQFLSKGSTRMEKKRPQKEGKKEEDGEKENGEGKEG